MNYRDFLGEHNLQGVEFGGGKVDAGWGEEYINWIDFRLDGVTYRAEEDPSDGYRSFSKEIKIADSDLDITIPNARVVGILMPDDSYRNDGITFIDVGTGGIVLEIGTKNYDDWYPFAHHEYHPENLACNALRREGE